MERTADSSSAFKSSRSPPAGHPATKCLVESWAARAAASSASGLERARVEEEEEELLLALLARSRPMRFCYREERKS